MSISTDIPLTITPEAEAHIAELDKRATVEEMTTFLRRMSPALGAIRGARTGL